MTGMEKRGISPKEVADIHLLVNPFVVFESFMYSLSAFKVGFVRGAVVISFMVGVVLA